MLLSTTLGQEELSGSLESVNAVLLNALLYFTIALLVVMLIIGIFVKIFKPEKLKLFGNISIGVIIGYSISISFVAAYLTMYRNYLEDEMDTEFWLVFVALIAIVAIIIAGIIIKISKPKAFKLFAIISGAAIAAYMIVLMFITKTESRYEPSNKVLLNVFSLILIAIIALIALIMDKKRGYNDSKPLTYAAICIALSFALSYIKLFSFPQGGSVTFASLLPLMLYSYIFGVRRGVFCGIIYGFLQFIQSPQFNQPVQFLLDYPIAFGAIGVAGMFRGLKIFKNLKIVEFFAGATVAVLLRYISHVIGGVFVFYIYADPGQSALAYSLIYNIFTLVDLAIVLFASVFLLLNKSFCRQIDKISYFVPNKSENEFDEIPLVK